MESSIRNEIKVGIFVAIGIVSFCLAIILLGGDQMFFRRSYELKVHLPQVQGLAPGSIVSLSGVPIGNVKRIEFTDQAKKIQVAMDIDQNVRSRLTEGTKASIKTQGALGDKYIFLEPGPTDAKPLNPGDLVLSDDSPDFLDLIGQKSSEVTQVFDVIKELNLLFRTLNENGRSKNLMENMVNGSSNFNKLMLEGRETMAHFSSIGKKIDGGNGTLGALINDPSMHNRIMSLIGDTPRNKFLKPMIRDTIKTNEKVNPH